MCNKREGASSTPMKIKKCSKYTKLHNKRDSEIAFLKKRLSLQNVYIKLKGKSKINSILVRIKAGWCNNQSKLISDECYKSATVCDAPWLLKSDLWMANKGCFTSRRSKALFLIELTQQFSSRKKKLK